MLRAARESSRRIGFLRKWKLRCKAVRVSFEEAGDELFTFTAFPCSQWKALRTTNALERINEEFRRRTKTQASLPSEEAVLFLLFGLLRSGQVRLRRCRWLMLITFPPIDRHHPCRVMGYSRDSTGSRNYTIKGGGAAL